ncbi:GNAT family N-acetyltransferase [Sphingomonas sp. 37zxx]|uniref:GNAT family N-acetyltransferase n=1 Tax=Sphingomonas sp. 37zxx TaxID=1550073 RepID=UPI002F3E6C5C
MFNALDLRPGGPGDMGLIAALMADAFDPAFGEAWTAGQCLGILSLPGVWLTLASIDGVPAGFSLARITLDEAELLLLATAPQLRRCGVGGRLLRATMRDAQTRGASKIHLEVRATNPAVNLYLREGFIKVGERRDYYRGHDGRSHDAHSFLRSFDNN